MVITLCTIVISHSPFFPSAFLFPSNEKTQNNHRHGWKDKASAPQNQQTEEGTYSWLSIFTRTRCNVWFSPIACDDKKHVPSPFSLIPAKIKSMDQQGAAS